MTLQLRTKVAVGAASAVVLAWLLFYPSERDRLDAEARRLCAIDGGIKVFETVALPPEQFHPNGEPMVPNDKDDRNFGYYRTYEYRNLRKDYTLPTLIREEHQFRRSDGGKVIATNVIYRRAGGCWWDGAIHGCGFSCPDDANNTSFTRFAFKKKGDKK